MKRNRTMEEFRQAARAAMAKAQAVQDAVGQRKGPAAPGDLFLVHGPAQVGIRWAIVLRHPTDPLVFSLPCDTHPQIGSTDIAIAEDALMGPAALRCEFGRWFDVDDFDPNMRIGLIEECYLKLVREKLREIFTGKLQGTPDQFDTDEDFEYEKWRGELSHAAHVLTEAVRTERMTLTRDDFFRSALAEPAFAMAADPGETTSAAPSRAPSPQRQLEFAYPGAIGLTLVPEKGVLFEYAPQGTQEPPELHEISADGTAKLIEWAESSTGCFRCLIRWTGGRVAVRLSGAGRTKEVIIEL